MHQDHFNSAGVTIWLPIIVLILVLIVYLAGVAKVKRAGKSWSSFRTTCFICGTCLLIIALAPPLANYAHHDLRGHMVQHLLIGMLAPLVLVLAAPFTLCLRILPTLKSRKITSLLGSRPFHLISNPVSALLLNIGGMYLLYLTPLYAAMQTKAWIHYLVHFHFLAAGYLFAWSIAGPDPAPKRAAFRFRLLVLLVGMATHAWLSKLMFAYEFPRDTTHSIEEIQEASMIMYYGGDFAEVLLAISLFFTWRRHKGLIYNPLTT